MQTTLKTAAKDSREHGFTLLELMIVVVIIGLIAAFAYPQYRQSVLKSHRSDAQVALMQTSQTLERCYAQYAGYDNTSCPVQDGANFQSPKGFYNISVKLTNTSTAATKPVGYTITATANGGQKDDKTCRTLKLYQSGKTTAKSAGGSSTSNKCWG